MSRSLNCPQAVFSCSQTNVLGHFRSSQINLCSFTHIEVDLIQVSFSSVLLYYLLSWFLIHVLILGALLVERPADIEEGMLSISILNEDGYNKHICEAQFIYFFRLELRIQYDLKCVWNITVYIKCNFSYEYIYKRKVF